MSTLNIGIRGGAGTTCGVIFSHTRISGDPPTEKKLEVSRLLILRFEEGKIVGAWEEFDSPGWMQQIGYELRLKEEK